MIPGSKGLKSDASLLARGFLILEPGIKEVKIRSHQLKTRPFGGRVFFAPASGANLIEMIH